MTVIVVIFCSLSLVYLSYTNKAATKGYTLKKLQQERVQLQTELDIWNLKVSQLQSIHSIKLSKHYQQMVAPEESPTYIQEENITASIQNNPNL